MILYIDEFTHFIYHLRHDSASAHTRTDIFVDDYSADLRYYFSPFSSPTILPAITHAASRCHSRCWFRISSCHSRCLIIDFDERRSFAPTIAHAPRRHSVHFWCFLYVHFDVNAIASYFSRLTSHTYFVMIIYASFIVKDIILSWELFFISISLSADIFISLFSLAAFERL